MGALIVFGFVIAAVVIFDLLAYRLGTDSRPGFQPRPDGLVLD